MSSSFSSESLKAFAVRMLADYDAVNPGSVYAEGVRLDLADAWRVQTAVTELREARGEQVIGYKVGAITPGNQKMMGLTQPVWGRLWDSELHASGASLNKSDFANLAIEAEFGVTLSRDLVPGMSLDQITASVDAVYPLLELHNLVLRGDAPHGHELVANNCIFSGVVRGEPVTDLASSTVTDLSLVFDGAVQDSWESLAWPTDLLRAVSWLTSSLDDHGLTIKAGQLVLTSAWGPPIPVGNHSRVEVISSAFGTASAAFA